MRKIREEEWCELVSQDKSLFEFMQPGPRNEQGHSDLTE